MQSTHRFYYENMLPPNNRFTCDLECHMCSHNGCDMHVSIGLPYCVRHSHDNGFRIARSHLPGATFNGVIATRNFDANVILGPYNGEMLTLSELGLRYGANINDHAPYAVTNDSYDVARVIDAACSRWMMSMVNSGAREIDCNAAIVINDNEHDPSFHDIDVVSTCIITAGEEVLAWYGDDYMQEMGNCRHYTLPLPV
jgi:hypothetical protein